MTFDWLKEKFPHYSMCHACALRKGAVAVEGSCTVVMGNCPYCGSKDVTLIPWVDFDWPEDPVADRKAKVARD